MEQHYLSSGAVLRLRLSGNENKDKTSYSSDWRNNKRHAEVDGVKR